MANRRPFVAGT